MRFDPFMFVIVLFAILMVYSLVSQKIAADAKARKERSERGSLDGDEDELLHEIWKALDKMDDRITNLETILLERGRGADRIMK